MLNCNPLTHSTYSHVGFHDGDNLRITANALEFENDDTYDCDKDVARSTIW